MERLEILRPQYGLTEVESDLLAETVLKSSHVSLRWETKLNYSQNYLSFRFCQLSVEQVDTILEEVMKMRTEGMERILLLLDIRDNNIFGVSMEKVHIPVILWHVSVFFLKAKISIT